MEKAFSYIRVSGRGQVAGDGPDRQRDAVARYAKAHGLEVVEEFADLGVSGTKDAWNRPGLAELVARLAGNGVRLVLVERADRLARDVLVSETLFNEFRKVGVRCVEAASGVELTGDLVDADPTRVLIRQMLMALAQWERSIIALKLRGARMKRRRETGRCEGVKPFGTLPGEAAAVDRMKALRRKPRGGEPLSFAAVAARLNAEAVPSRSGKPWSGSLVRRILARGGHAA